MAPDATVSKPLAVMLGIAYALAVALIVLREVQRQQGLMRTRQRQGAPLPLRALRRR